MDSLKDILNHREELNHQIIDLRFLYSELYKEIIDFYLSKKYPKLNIKEESKKEYENRKKRKEERDKELSE